MPYDLSKMSDAELMALYSQKNKQQRKQERSSVKKSALGLLSGFARGFPGSDIAGAAIGQFITDPAMSAVQLMRGRVTPEELAKRQRREALHPLQTLAERRKEFAKTGERLEAAAPGFAGAGKMLAAIPQYMGGAGLLKAIPRLAGAGVSPAAARGALASLGIAQAEDPSLARAPLDVTLGALEAVPAVGRGVQKLGKGIYQKAFGLTPREMKKSKKMLDTLFKERVWGRQQSLLKRSDQMIGELTSQVDDSIANAMRAGDKTVDMSHVLDELQDVKSMYKDLPTRIGETKQIDQTIKKLRSAGPLTLDQAQSMKKKIYRIRESFYKSKGALETKPVKLQQEVAMATGLRKGLEKKVPTLAEINRRLGAYAQLGDVMEGAVAKGAASGIPLKTLLLGFGGGAMGGPAAAFGAGIGSQIAKGTAVRTGTGQALGALGRLIERGGRAAAPAAVAGIAPLR